LRRYAPAAISLLSFLVLAAGTLPASAANGSSSQAKAPSSSSKSYNEPLCQSKHSLCTDAYRYPGGQYVGHDEPSLEFKSSRPGSGNNMTYTVTLPRDPKIQLNATGKGGTTWNFELRPTFWFGLTLCDSQSAPEFTTQCTPDSDSNNLVGTNPNSPTRRW
jgi:hypothetical protein